jgi:hypothetical protein
MMRTQRDCNPIVLQLMLALTTLLSAVTAQQPAAPSKSDSYAYARLKGRQITLFEQWAAEQNRKNGTDLHSATIYGSLTQSQRTTCEAVMHGLSRSKLTDNGGRVLKQNALELVTSINAIAGQISGVGGDKQYRLYVSLSPETQDILTRSREFFRDKDNTVFHKDYPINFRQRGKEPTLQISISKDGSRADIDVDYRSSRPPQALINGHLRAANSDVRVGGNYLGHISRWFGLIRWWRIILDPESEAEFKSAEAISASVVSPVPTSRHATAPALTPEQIAEAQAVAQATHEFLTMWLIKRDRKRADDYLTKRPVACANLDGDRENETAEGETAIREFALLLDAGLKAKSKHRSLEEAVAAVAPWDPEMVFIDHPHKHLFSLHGIQLDEAAEYMCDSLRLAGDPNAYGHFYLADFKLNLAKENGGGLEILWMKEDERWQIISYDVLEP